MEVFLAVIGPPAVGKTAITNRLINQKFIESYHPTIQDEFKQAFIIENHAISISLLDTTGSEQYFSINAQHISSRDACIFVVSVDKEESIADILDYLNLWKTSTKQKRPGILVLNKIDIHSDAVKKEDCIRLAANFKLLFIDVSAKTGENIADMLKSIVKEIPKVKSLIEEDLANMASPLVNAEKGSLPNESQSMQGSNKKEVDRKGQKKESTSSTRSAKEYKPKGFFASLCSCFG